MEWIVLWLFIWLIGSSFPVIRSFWRPSVNDLIQQLSSKDEVKRIRAAGQLKAKSSKAVKPLVKALLSPFYSIYTRQLIAQILGDIRDPEAFDALMKVLHDSTLMIKQEAVTALGKLGDERAIPALRSQLRHADKHVRWRAVVALRELHDDLFSEQYVRALRDPNSTVREVAVIALGYSEDQRALPYLQEALKDPDTEVRNKAQEALKRLGENTTSPEITSQNIDTQVSNSVWNAKLHHADWQIRWKAVEELGHIQAPEAAPLLLQALQDSDWSVRLKALEALKKTPGTISVSLIVPLLTDAHLDVRDAASELLIQVGSAGIDDLLPLLQADDVVLRERAVWILAQIKDERLVEPLMTALRDSDMGVRQQAANGLKQLGNLAVDYLLEVVNHNDGDVQWRAVQALGEIGNPKAVAALVPILRDDDEDVRAKTAQVLTDLGWTPDTDEERICFYLAQQAWNQIPRFEAQAIPPLVQLATDRDRLVRQAAIRLLTQMLASIETVVFGSGTGDNYPTSSTLRNVDISSLEIALPALCQIVVFVDTYDFQQVERFLTYAVNQVGQEHLKQSVTVSVHGQADRLHPNLRNVFANLCQSVQFRP